MRNEISSSKKRRKRSPVLLHRKKSPWKAPMINVDQYRKAARSDGIEERNKACGDRLCGGEENKAEGEEESGHNTALTRRGLIVMLLS